MEIRQCMLTNNDCYKKATKMTPRGILVHSTGANNPNLKRYVQPDDGLLGVNKYNNSWNRSGLNVCVHAMIGKDKNGDVRLYQLLPFDISAWGVGNGKKGSYNYNPTGHIQFEICEDGLTDENYFNQAFGLAIEFCAYLCKEFNLSVDSIVGHHEAYLKGYGSNHSDPENWTKKFGKDMNWFRNEVRKKLEDKPKEEWTTGTYQLTKAKYVRKSPIVFNNRFRVKDLKAKGEGWTDDELKMLVSRRDNDYAQLRVGSILQITKISKEGKNTWGKYGNYGSDWVCLCDSTGPQSNKL